MPPPRAASLPRLNDTRCWAASPREDSPAFTDTSLPAPAGEHDVDHAGHRIGPIDGRRTAAQYFHAFDDGQRDAVQIGQPAQIRRHQPVIGDAPAVDQEQGGARPQHVQTGRGRRCRWLLEPWPAVGRNIDRMMAGHAGLEAQQLEQCLVTAAFYLMVVDHGHRRHAHRLPVGTPQMAAGDHRPQFDGIRRCRRSCNRRGQRRMSMDRGALDHEDSLACRRSPQAAAGQQLPQGIAGEYSPRSARAERPETTSGS
jgi:hypothetical protein